MEEKNKGGRPRLETTIPDGWREIILDAGAQGKHITDFLITLGISWDGHYALIKRNQRYSETIQEYQKLCEQWWYEKARTSMEESEGAGFNTKLFSLIMRNKFGNHWSEASRVDVTTNGDKIQQNSIQIEIIKPKLEDEN